MSTTRIVFIIVCVVVAVIVTTLGIVIQKNNPDNKYSVTNTPKPAGTRRKKFKLPNNPSIFMTVFLIILLLFLVLVYSGRNN